MCCLLEKLEGYNCSNTTPFWRLLKHWHFWILGWVNFQRYNIPSIHHRLILVKHQNFLPSQHLRTAIWFFIAWNCQKSKIGPPELFIRALFIHLGGAFYNLCFKIVGCAWTETIEIIRICMPHKWKFRNVINLAEIKLQFEKSSFAPTDAHPLACQPWQPSSAENLEIPQKW